MAIYTDVVEAHCDICNRDYRQVYNYRVHCKDFAYEHACIENGNSEFGAWHATIFFCKSAFSEFSCALDERLSGESDGRQMKQLFDDMRALFSLPTLKFLSLYILIEVATVAADSKYGGTFSAFVETIFYIGWTEGVAARRQNHAREERMVCWLTPMIIPISSF